jgi:hypothetical protein
MTRPNTEASHPQYCGNEPNTAPNTDTQMEQSCLECTISELEKNLKDPNCTRDNDDVMTELRQSQRDLSRLKWKRLLGI